MSLTARIIRTIIACVILAFAICLPYRWRIKYSDLLGKSVNLLYHAYLKLLEWFLKKLES